MRPIPKRLLNRTVVVREEGPDFGDGPTLGPPVEHPARVNYEQRLVRSATGEEVVSSSTVIMRPGTGINVGTSQLTLPGETSASTILSVAEHTGIAAGIYTEVTVR